MKLQLIKRNTKIKFLLYCVSFFQICSFLTSCTPYDDIETVIIPTVSEEEAKPELHGLYDVVRVVDGDTIVVSIEGKETTVRFIGIDTAESVHPDETRNTEIGKEASQWTSDLLTGQKVFLEYDIDKEDDYGRTLAYVYLSDGETMVQEELLKAEMAELMTIQPNSKYADKFFEIKSDR